MNIKKLITDLQVCADEEIICPACDRYHKMKEKGGTAECVEKLLREAAAALEEMQKRISEAETEVEKREKVVVSLRKKWQEAETLICTMCANCGHEDHDGILCMQLHCGEITGYPCCGKFKPKDGWIPVSEPPKEVT